MANTIANLSNALGILKNYYSGPIVSQFNDEIPLYKEMERGKEKFNGLQVVRPIKLRRNPGIGATSDGGILPSAGKSNVQQATISAKYNYLVFSFTAPLLKASQGDKGSFVSIMEHEMSSGLDDIKQDVNRQMSWDGTGTIATVAANAVGSNVLSLTGRESTEAGNKFLSVDMMIDCYSSAGVLKFSSAQITAITGTTTATVTLDQAVTCAATDIITRAGAYNNEIQGLLTSQDGGTSSIYGINRATYSQYQGNLVSGSGQQLTLDLLQQTYNELRRRGGGKLNFVGSDYDSERWYQKLLVSEKRFTGKIKGDGTFSDPNQNYLEYAGVPWVCDKDMPTRVFMQDMSTYKKYVLGAELEWADETGSYMIAKNSADAWEVRLRLFANVFPEKPAANAVLSSYISP